MIPIMAKKDHLFNYLRECRGQWFDRDHLEEVVMELTGEDNFNIAYALIAFIGKGILDIQHRQDGTYFSMPTQFNTYRAQEYYLQRKERYFSKLRGES